MDEKHIDWTGPSLLGAAEVQRADGDLLVLDDTGGIACIDLASGAIAPLGRVALPDPQPEQDSRCGVRTGWRLHASANGAFAAIVRDGGRPGLVVRLSDFAITLRLDGGDYHPDTVPFSACFLLIDGRDVLIHRSAWNRLDASDPDSGALLTARAPTHYIDGVCPEHYLDYFHGQLYPSPAGSQLLDDGWAWQPVGVLRVFDPRAWLGGQVWESEDGASVRYLTQSDDWNIPMCWIDEQRIVRGGLGIWDVEEFQTTTAPPGAWIIDLGPGEIAYQRALPMDSEASALFCDGLRVFAVHEHGTSVWPLATDTRGEDIVGFRATHLHRRCAALLQITQGSIRLLSIGPLSVV